MLFDAAVILATVPALVMNWRTQRAAPMVAASASMTGPMTERWKGSVEMLVGGEANGESSNGPGNPLGLTQGTPGPSGKGSG